METYEKKIWLEDLKILILRCLFIIYKDTTFMIQVNPLNIRKIMKKRQRKENIRWNHRRYIIIESSVAHGMLMIESLMIYFNRIAGGIFLRCLFIPIDKIYQWNYSRCFRQYNYNQWG